MAESGGLQLEHAEFEGGRGSGCVICKRVLQGSYFEVNGHAACEACCERLRTELTQGSRSSRIVRAVGAGAAAAAVGSLLYYAILAMTGYEFGLIAIVVGLGVGKAVNWGCHGRGGWAYQTLAIVLTYLAIVTAYVPQIVSELRKVAKDAQTSVTATSAAGTEQVSSSTTPASGESPRAPEGGSGPSAGKVILAILLLLALACAVPIFGGLQNIMGLIIIGIGLYEAWKLNRRRTLTITGPHPLVSARPAGA